MRIPFHYFRQTLLVAAACSLCSVSLASSHSDAPLIKQDPQVNLTDVYAFIAPRYDDANQPTLTVLVNVRPFSEPGDGVMYDRFAPDAQYSIHIANPTTGQTLIRYNFAFSSVTKGYKNTDTILSYGLGTEAGPIQDIGDARQNYVQTYDVERAQGVSGRKIGRHLTVPPPNVGQNVTPYYNDPNGVPVSGATTFGALDRYTQQGIHALPTGEVVFAGPRDDSFFADTPAIFDLLAVRILDNNGDLGDGLGQDGNGVDGFKGFNVLTYGIQIPLSQLPALPYNSVFFGQQTGVGVYASVSRQLFRLYFGGKPTGLGPWVQVNRLGNPLFNEVLVALADKDNYNTSHPTQDASKFAVYAREPELAGLINFVYSTNFATTMREDLVNVYIPDVIRVNTTTGPVPQPGQAAFNRLGFIGGDTTAGVSSGWPNGRRFGDDVVDIALTAVASGPGYASITVVGDNAAANDMPYNQVFPYAATPHAGPTNRKDPQ